MLEKRPSVVSCSPDSVVGAWSRFVIDQRTAQRVVSDVDALESGFAVEADFFILRDNTAVGRVGGVCFALSQQRRLAILVIEPCEK